MFFLQCFYVTLSPLCFYVYPIPSNYNLPSTDSVSSSADVFLLGQCTESEVSDAIGKLKTTKSVGPDQMPSYILRACSESLTGPLTFIFNLALASSTFPSAFKSSYVRPIPKKGNSSDLLNFRPISILSPFCKVFEQILFDRIYWHVSSRLSPQQHGFVKKKSTLTNLLSFINDVYLSFSSRLQVDVIYLDFEKAFDKINHDILLAKLSSFNFHPSALSFFASYLSDRLQYVRYKGHFSRPFHASSGVPQGSKLGPLLFLLAINDIVTVPLHSRLLLFADDVKLYFRISSLSDCLLLQSDLNAISAWATSNLFQINISKSQFMSFTRRKSLFDFVYRVGDTPLTRVFQINDLGVIFDPKLRFSIHIDAIIRKANQSLGFLLRNTVRLSDVDTLKMLYTAFVRSKLEYCSSIWYPNKADNNRIERVQARFVRILFFRLNGFYPSFPNQISYQLLLSHIGLESLSARRIKHDLFFLHKLLNGSIHDCNLLEQVGLYVPYHNLRPQPRPLFSLNSLSPNTCLGRITNSFNSFNPALDIFSPFPAFKKSVVETLEGF